MEGYFEPVLRWPPERKRRGPYRSLEALGPQESPYQDLYQQVWFHIGNLFLARWKPFRGQIETFSAPWKPFLRGSEKVSYRKPFWGRDGTDWSVLFPAPQALLRGT